VSEDWKHYFEQSLNKTYFSFEGEESDYLLSQVTFFHQIEKLDLEEFDVAIIGVADGRYSVNKGVADYPNVCRSYLFGLRSLVKSIKILDLGNLLGKTVDDRYRALEDIVTILVRNDVLPVVIGGSQDYTISLSGAIKNINDTFRLSVVDAKIDWVIPEKDFSSHGYLGLLSSDKNRKPYDLSVIGVQRYFYSRYQEQKMKKASFDFLRLGEIRQKGLPIAEPWLRDADAVSFDLNSIKQSDQPAHSFPMPNGFSGNEFCQLCWYAGISDQLKVVGFFELDINADVNSLGSMLGAQGVWHVLEGFCSRYNDFPVKNLDDYSQYIVHLDDYEIDIRFYNNPSNGRWWVEVPSAEGKQIVACSKDEFEEASKNELPERWYRFINKKVL